MGRTAMKCAVVVLVCAVGCAAPRHASPAPTTAAPEGEAHASAAAEPFDIAGYRELLAQAPAPEPAAAPPQRPSPLLTPTLRPRRLSANAQEAEPYQHCSQDSDCVVVVNGCCSPGRGEAGIGIRKDKQRAFLKSFDCTDVPCQMSALIGGGKPVARCLNELCYYDGVL